MREYHGMSRTRVYNIWCLMKARCATKNRPDYWRYGGRGISVCGRWHRFSQFLADMGRPPTPKHSIDRIDGNRGYEPGNCRWATQAEQVRNSSRAKKVTVGRETKCLSDWASDSGLRLSTVSDRLRQGSSLARALTPGRLTRKDVATICVAGEVMRLIDAARRFGIKRRTISERIRLGWDPTKAATTPARKYGGTPCSQSSQS